MNENEINEIANTLEESGLFDWWIEKKLKSGWVPGGIWPTADESEEILRKMGLQVIYDKSFDEGSGVWTLLNIYDPYGDGSETGIDFERREIAAFDPVQGSSLANNAALAWLCKNRFDDLKTAVADYRAETMDKP